jgi:biotin transporter BioY
VNSAPNPAGTASCSGWAALASNAAFALAFKLKRALIGGVFAAEYLVRHRLHNMKKSTHILLILLCGALVMAVTVLGYLSLYFTASQPNYHRSFLVDALAWTCICAIPVELLVTICLTIRAAFKTSQDDTTRHDA